ncbi:MAG: pyridoxamine 5'-phosphate oxidase family protein [Carnobacterium sp.]|uniref:pyridoxamine 5'-phosphate oxidase family protein n=1 Tax=Carnobacterium sp. TaxID=48221 RepID=UPI003C7399CE
MKIADEREKALKIVSKNKIDVLTTVSCNKPKSYYMTFFNEGFILYTLTDKRTGKVEEIKENPHAFVLLGDEEGFLDKNYVEIEGGLTLTEDQSLIEHLWSPYMNLIFDSKEDPNIIVLQLKLEIIRLRETKNDEAISINLN